MKEVEIPTYADEPPHFLLWSADEMLPIIFGFGMGIIIDQVFFLTIAGFVVSHYYKKFRDQHPDGFLFHLAYWYGFGFCRSRSMTNPFVRKFFP